MSEPQRSRPTTLGFAAIARIAEIAAELRELGDAARDPGLARIALVLEGYADDARVNISRDDLPSELERRRAAGLAAPAVRAGQARDEHRVDPAGHRGLDLGTLHRSFTLPADRSDDDHRGPRQLPPRPRP